MRIWGFDLGTTSIGFAVVDHDPGNRVGRIHRLGVRIFPEGITEDKKEPRNKTRRAKRLMRRSIRRRKLRRRLLNETLATASLLPRYGTADWGTVMSDDPYRLRYAGLSCRLEPYQLGRALYHLAKRRGFADRTIDETDEKLDPEDVTARDDDESFAQEIGEATLGAFLVKQTKKRGRHHTREMVQDEFERLWAVQKRYHQILKDPAFGSRIRDLIFSQRPTFWRLSTLSRCQFCPDDELEPKGGWSGQEFLLLEQLTKLRIAGADARSLSDKERAILYDLAHRHKSVSWNGVRKALRNHWREREEREDAIFNMEIAKSETGIRGNVVEYELRKVFGDLWDGHPHRDEIRRQIHGRLWSADFLQVGKSRVEIRRPGDAQKIRRRERNEMQHDWDLTDAQADDLAKLQLPGKWLGWSRTAVSEMLPLMEKGESVGSLTRAPEWQSWRERTFPGREQPTGEVRDFLPSDPRCMPKLRNPTIHRALNELRKVVNNLIDLYGRPDLFRIELTRELRESKERRSERLWRDKKQEGERKKAAVDLEAHGITNPSRGDIEKWLLWRESNERCPYTGDHIGFDALFRDGKYQVEHIWPRSVSLDNKFANKTLCRTDINILKGNRTPYQVWGGDPEAWNKLKQSVSECKLPEYKVRRIMKVDLANAESTGELGDDGFSQRQHSDSGWVAREARDFLKRLWPDDGSIAPVETVNGRLTGQLRHQWGLDSILNADGWGKSRADHRHHAVDALTVALTSRASVKRLADWYKLRETGARPPQFEAPWSALFEEAKVKVSDIVVSHRTRRKVSGALHAETVMGDTKLDEKTKSGIYRLFVTRKPIDRLSEKRIATIRDPRIRDIVARHVAERGGDPKKASQRYPRLPGKNGREGPEIRRVRLTTKEQVNLMVPVGTGYAAAAANHHIAVFRTGNNAVRFSVISLYEAARRVSARQPVIRRSNGDGSTFLMSLSAGDTLAFPSTDGSPRYRIVQSIWANGQIVLLDHTDASKEQTSKSQPGIPSIITTGCYKVSVDPIGRVRPARD